MANKQGRNKSDVIDVLTGDDTDDILNPFQGPSILTGGAGADEFHFDSWAASNLTYGTATITDFSSADGDKIGVAGIKHYFDSNGDGTVDSARALTADDISQVGDVVTVSVWEGDATWDLTFSVNTTLTISDFIL